jgi:molybdopterin-guanine dinucleotide biosynthesis protein B
MHELRGDDEPGLLELLDKLSPADLVLVEGFKSEPYPKIEIHRAANGKPTLFPDDRTIVGIATDAPVSTSLPIVDLDDVDGIATMVLQSAIEREALRGPGPVARDSAADPKATVRPPSTKRISS